MVKDTLLSESLRRLIIAHRDRDNATFQKVIESLIRELVVSNLHTEARRLQEALLPRRNGGSDFSNPVLSPVRRGGGASLIHWNNLRDPVREVILTRGNTSAFDNIIREHRATDKLAQHGLRPSSKLMFWGPPGCGKTISASMLAGRLGLPLGIVRLSSVITSYVGETAANISRIFEEVGETNMVLLFDEADALAKDREDPNDVGELKRVVNSLLQCLDDFNAAGSVIIFASNHQHMFDSAVWRRFDDILEFPLPSHDQRLHYLKNLTNGVKVNGSLTSIAKRLNEYSFSDLERIATSVIKKALLDGMKSIDADTLLTQASNYRKQANAATRRSGGRNK